MQEGRKGERKGRREGGREGGRERKNNIMSPEKTNLFSRLQLCDECRPVPHEVCFLCTPSHLASG